MSSDANALLDEIGAPKKPAAASATSLLDEVGAPPAPATNSTHALLDAVGAPAAPVADLPAARSRLAAMPFVDLPPGQEAVTSSAGTDVQAVQTPHEGRLAVDPGVTNSRMGEVGSRMAHGYADPIIEANKLTQADLDQEIRNNEARNAPPPATPQVSAGPAHGAAWREYQRAKGLGQGLVGAASALFTPIQMGLEAADSDPMPFIHRASGKVAENIIPRSMPGSIADQIIPEGLRKEVVGATQFGLENAPIALGMHELMRGAEPTPAAKARIGGPEAPVPTLERLADVRDRFEPTEGTTAQPRVQMQPPRVAPVRAVARPVAEPIAPPAETIPPVPETPAAAAEPAPPVVVPERRSDPLRRTRVQELEAQGMSHEEALQRSIVPDEPAPQAKPEIQPGIQAIADRARVQQPVPGDAPPEPQGSTVPPEASQEAPPPAEAPSAPQAQPPAAPDIPSDPRKMFFGRRSESGSAATPTLDAAKRLAFSPNSVLDQLLNAVEELFKEKVTQPALDKLGETRVGQAAKKVATAIYDPHMGRVGEGYKASEQAAARVRNTADYADAPILKSFAKALKDATPEQQAAVTEWGRRSKTSPDTPFPAAGFTPEQADAIQAGIRHLSETVRGEAVAAGAQSPHSFEEYPRYLPTRYEEFQQPPGPKGGAKVPALKTAHDGWGGRVLLPEGEAASLVGDTEPDYLKADKANEETLVKFSTPEAWEEFKKNGEARFGKDFGKIVKGEFTKFDPAAEGLTKITDPVQLLRTGIRETRARTAKMTFLNALADVTDEQGKYVLEPKSAEATRATRPENVAVGQTPGYEKLEGKDWGPLSGKLVRSDVAAELKRAYGERGELSDYEKAAKQLTDFNAGAQSVFKESHAVANPALSIRHAGAVRRMLRWSGTEPLNPENWPRIVKWLRDTAPGGKYHAESVAGGDYAGRGGMFSPEEIASQEDMKGWDARRVARAIFSGGVTEGLGVEALGKKFGWDPVESAGRKLKEGYIAGKQTLSSIANKPYEGVERIIRAKALDEGMTPEQAQAEVDKYTLSPGEFSDPTKFWSEMLSPFGRFRLGMAQRAAITAYEHPLRLAMDRFETKAIQAGLLAAGTVALTDKEKEQIANEHPGSIAIGRDKDGQPVLVDARYEDPLGDFYPGRQKIGEGLDTFTGIRKYGERATGIGDNPLIDFGESVVKGENRYGQPVEGPLGVAKEGARQFWPSQTPGVGWESSKVSHALKGTQASPSAQRQTPLQAFLEQIGIKEGSLDPLFEEGRMNTEARRKVSELKSGLRSGAKRGEAANLPAAGAEAKRIADELRSRKMPFATK